MLYKITQKKDGMQVISTRLKAFNNFGKKLEKSWKKSEKSWCFPEKIRKVVGILRVNNQ